MCFPLQFVSSPITKSVDNNDFSNLFAFVVSCCGVHYFLLLCSKIDQSQHHRPVTPAVEKRSTYRKMRLKPTNYIPRILLPDFTDSLPVYGPSIFNINKIQILPPLGPVFRHKTSATNIRPKFEQPMINQIEPIEPNITGTIKRELLGSDLDEEFDILRTSRCFLFILFSGTLFVLFCWDMGIISGTID